MKIAHRMKFHRLGLVTLAMSGCVASPSELDTQGDLGETTSDVVVDTVGALVNAVNNGAVGDTVVIEPGTYNLTAPLRPKAGMTIRGAGRGRTIIQGAPSWAPGRDGIDDDEGATLERLRCDSYLISLPRDSTQDLTISDLTLTGPNHHGAICGINIRNVTFERLEIRNFLWSGIRTFIMSGARIRDNTLIDAGGANSFNGGGGGLFLTYFENTQIYNNRISHIDHIYFGVKGRQGNFSRIFNNTIDAGYFSVELPFESDRFVDIDHNYLDGAVSLPRGGGGGDVPVDGYAFHIHHNYFKSSYSLEFPHSGVEIDNNLFDFELDRDDGTLISNFSSATATGPARMHDNLIRNPGRGLYAATAGGGYNNFSFYNNHVLGTSTVTPRTDALFYFGSSGTSWSSVAIRDNIITLTGTPRALLGNPDSYAATIENNTLTNITDTGNYTNKPASRPRGPLSPLNFYVGAYNEFVVNQWRFYAAPRTADYDGDRKADRAIYRPGTGEWFIVRSSDSQRASLGRFGLSTDLPMVGDYDGDGRMDRCVYRRSNGTWYIRGSKGGADSNLAFGNATDKPVAGDFDGDGRTDRALYRPSTGQWLFVRSTTGASASLGALGVSADVPVPGDFDGDGLTDRAVWRPSNGTWYVRPSSGTGVVTLQWGATTDIPVVGDYDGDGKVDRVVFRPSLGTWYARLSSRGDAGVTLGKFGRNTDVPVAADYDGDGTFDLAVYRPATGEMFYLSSKTGISSGVALGTASDRPLPRVRP